MHITQARIILSARKCFESAGLHKTRMEDIAAHAALSRQTLYKYFTSKKEIIDQLALNELITINNQICSRLRPRDSFADRLTDIIIFSVELTLANSYLRTIIEDASYGVDYPLRNPKLYAWHVKQWSIMLKEARDTDILIHDIDIPLTVRWITMCQIHLIAEYAKFKERNLPTRFLVQRFIVKPLLYSNAPEHIPSHASMQHALATENAMLRDLTATQALQIFQLQKENI